MTAPTVIALVPDLMDRSRVTAVATDVRFAPDLPALAAAVEESGEGAVVLLDLARDGALSAGAELVAGGTRVVAFAAHVDGDLFDAAGAAGIEVHPRSRLFRSLPAILEEAPDRHGGT